MNVITPEFEAACQAQLDRFYALYPDAQILATFALGRFLLAVRQPAGERAIRDKGDDLFEGTAQLAPELDQPLRRGFE